MLLNGFPSFGGSEGTVLKLPECSSMNIFEKSLILEIFIETFLLINDPGTGNLPQALDM